MNATEFFLKYKGKYLDYDCVAGDQCVDVIKQYFHEVLGLTPMRGNAIDYWKDIAGFKRIPNTPTNRPLPGDIIIWGTKYNLYGHIGIANWTRNMDFSCFEQNNPIGSPCHYEVHDYKNVLGWQRPLNPPAEAPRPQAKKYFNCVVVEENWISDQRLKQAEAFIDSKLNLWSAGKLGFKITRFVDAKITDPTPLTVFHTDEVMPYLKGLNLVPDLRDDYILILYSGNQMTQSWIYTVLYDNLWKIPFTIMPDNCGDFNDILLFEVGHGLIQCYNQRRGNLPSISNSDNYSGGESYVKAKVEAVLPHLELYNQST